MYHHRAYQLWKFQLPPTIGMKEGAQNIFTLGFTISRAALLALQVLLRSNYMWSETERRCLTPAFPKWWQGGSDVNSPTQPSLDKAGRLLRPSPPCIWKLTLWNGILALPEQCHVQDAVHDSASAETETVHRLALAKHIATINVVNRCSHRMTIHYSTLQHTSGLWPI